MYIQRTLQEFIKTADKQFPSLLVTGARQVGKTTLLEKQSESKRKFVTLDNPLALNLAKDDPALFLQKYSPPVIIDEIQYAPELLPYIKIAVDKYKEKGMFWLTGSQQFHLMKGVSESLAGRVAVITLMGLSRREMLGKDQSSNPFIPLTKEIESRLHTGGSLNLKSLYSIIWRGSYPAVVSDKKIDKDLFYSSYVQTYLQRDVRNLARVGNETAFIRFLRVTAARSGQMLNITGLARDADIAVNTAKNWISILQTSGIVYLLEPYFNNVTKRLVKTPKIYFLDTGLCSYLTQWSNPETLESGAMSGAILETWIISELLKGFLHHGRRAPFYYYRDKDQKEIDLLIIQDGTIYPLEFKKTASPNIESVRHFDTLEKLGMPIGSGGVICLTQDFLPLTKKNYAIPISAI
jgi:uncharacterized protein